VPDCELSVTSYVTKLATHWMISAALGVCDAFFVFCCVFPHFCVYSMSTTMLPSKINIFNDFTKSKDEYLLTTN
jgi:hypothetical protein